MRKFLSFIIVAALALSMLIGATVTALAASSTQDGLTATITTDKANYSAGETANIAVSVTNTNAYAVDNVSLKLALPAGLALKSGQTSITVGTLQAGATQNYALTATAGQAAPASPTTPTTPNTQPTKSQTTASIAVSSSPQTGDTFPLGRYITLIILAASGLIAAVLVRVKSGGNKKRKYLATTLSLFLGVALVMAAIAPSAPVFAATESRSLTATQPVTVSGNSENVTLTVTYDYLLTPDTPDTSVYQITYDANGGANAPAAGSFDIVSGTAAATTADGGGMTPPGAGYTFVGWNTAANGSGTFFTGGDSLNLSSDLVLYAMWSGDGASSASPILVYDYDTLNNVRDGLSLDYKVVADIDAGGAWVPIGNGANGEPDYFSGTFDGGGHTVNISGIGAVTPDNHNMDYIGLFGVLGANGMIQDLLVAGSLSYTESNNSISMGGVAGYNNGGTIQNCVVTADVSGESPSHGIFFYMGGIAGYNYTGTIQNCYSTGDVSCNNSVGGIIWAGGIVGYSSGNGITACYATGPVQASAQGMTSVALGGIAEYSGGVLSNCVALNPNITGISPGGSLTLGRVTAGSGGTLANNFSIPIGGLPDGTSTDTNGATITKAQALQKTAYSAAAPGGAGWSFGTTDASPWVWGPDAGFSDYTLPVLYWQKTAPALPAHLSPAGLAADAEAAKVTGFAPDTNTTGATMSSTGNDSTLVFKPDINGTLAGGAAFSLVSLRAGVNASSAAPFTGGAGMDPSTGKLSLSTQNIVDAYTLDYVSVTFTVTAGGVVSTPVTIDISNLFGTDTTADKLRTDKTAIEEQQQSADGLWIDLYSSYAGDLPLDVNTDPTIQLLPGVSMPQTDNDATASDSGATGYIYSDQDGYVTVHLTGPAQGEGDISFTDVPLVCAGTAYYIETINISVWINNPSPV